MKRYKTSLTLLVIALIITLSFSGCGSGGSSAPKINQLTTEQLTTIAQLHDDITGLIETKLQTTPSGMAYAEVANQLRSNPEIASATAQADSLNVVYKCGTVEQWITPPPPQIPVDFSSRATTLLKRARAGRATSPVAKSVWINPFDDQPGNWFQQGASLKGDYRRLLENCGYQHDTDILNAGASIDFFASNLSQYGVVVLMTHGGLFTYNNDGYVSYATRTERSLENNILYKEALVAQPGEACPKLIKCNIAGYGFLGWFEKKVYAITPAFIAAHYPKNAFNNTFVITNACHSLQNMTMVDALSAAGVYAYAGWTESDSDGWWRNYELLANLATGINLGDAYQNMVKAGTVMDQGSVAQLTYAPSFHNDYTLLSSGNKAPIIMVQSPTDNSTFNTRVCRVSGAITNMDEHTTVKISLNGNPSGLEITAVGDFTHNVVLSPGDNTIAITATNWQGQTSRVIHVNATIPSMALWTELSWSTDGTDIDLHLVKPGGQPGGDDDCGFFNESPDWGVIGNSDDNPSLDVDDTDGRGPEHITMNTAVPGRYLLYVHYYNDHGVTAHTYSRLAVSVNNAPIRYFGPQELINNVSDPDHGDFWQVCYIDYPSGTITPINQVETRSFLRLKAFPVKTPANRTRR